MSFTNPSVRATTRAGTVPAFGESVIEVPLTASAMRMAHQVFGVMRGGGPPEKLNYAMTGKLNGGTFGSEAHMPFGGLKQSGNGSREPGTEALDIYSSLKDIYVNLDPAYV